MTMTFVRRGTLALCLLTVTIIVASVRYDIDADRVEKTYALSPSKFIEAGGVRFHYRDVGTGPTLLLIHGQSANLFTWAGWVKELSNEFRVISVDLPGHGLTGPDPQLRYSWQELADLIEAFTLKLGIDHFTIAGNSLGGAIAMRYTLSRPQKIKKLILISSIGYRPQEPAAAIFRMLAAPVIGHVLNATTTTRFIRTGLAMAYGDPTKLSAESVVRYRDLTRRDGNRAASRKILQHSLRPGTFESLAEQVPSIEVPTLILWGKSDAFALPKYAKWFEQALPNATLYMFANVGHLPMEEAPGETAQRVREFLESD